MSIDRLTKNCKEKWFTAPIYMDFLPF